jgi:hypothetical protein
MKHFLFKSLTLAVLLSPEVGWSAELSFKPDDSTGCNIQMTGLIADGDAENLRKIYTNNITSNASISREGGGVGARICLDSPGGSLVEAFKIFDYLTSSTENAMTYVPKGAKCESACAIVFLAGGNGYYGSRPARAMHPTARLGFHSPDLMIQDGNYNKKEVSKAYSLALETISRLLKLRRTPLADSTMLPSSVIEVMLSTPPEEMYYVETVGQAAQWGISIFPVRSPDDFSELNWLAGCLNSAGMINDSPPYYDPMDRDWAAAFSNEEYEGARPTLPENGPPFIFGMGEGSECIIDFNFDPTVLQFSEVSVGQEVKDVYVHYPEYIFYGANTKIVDLPTTNETLAGSFSDRFSYLRSRVADVTSIDKACSISSSETKIQNVSNFTNLRSTADSQAEVIDRVPLGASVKVKEPRVIWTFERCFAECGGNNQSAINACIDNNDVWIEVEYRGLTGFLSRKFLE